MPKILLVLRLLCMLTFVSLGVVSAVHRVWIACTCIVIIMWETRPDVLKLRQR